MDQREVEQKRASGVFDEKKAIEKSKAVKAYRAEKAASNGLVEGSETVAKKGLVETSEKAAKKGLARLGKAVPIVGTAATGASVGYNIHQGNYVDAGVDIVSEVPVVGTAFGAGYAIGTVANEFLSDETKDAIGGTISETLENGLTNVKGYYFGR